jgi:hypothetical protein
MRQPKNFIKKRKPVTEVVVPGLFDEALPVALQSNNDTKTERHIRVERGLGSTPSPYIIKLTRAPVVENRFSLRGHVEPLLEANGVEALAASLIFDVGNEDDAVPLCLAEPEFLATTEEMQGQLAEMDILLDIPTFDESELSSRVLAADGKFSNIMWQKIDLDEVLPGNLDPNTGLAEIEVTNDASPSVVSFSKASPSPSITGGGFTKGWQRALAAFTGLAMLLVLPLHALQAFGSVRASSTAIQAVSTAALGEFGRGASDLAGARYDVASDEFSRAALQFSEAEAKLDGMQASVVAVVNVIPQTDRTYNSVKGLITAGRELSTVAQIMSAAGESVGGKESTDVVAKLSLLTTAVSLMSPHVDLAAEGLKNVDAKVVPADYQQKVADLQLYVPQLATALHEFMTFSAALQTMLGAQGDMRYLVAFQNNTELRPTGGFIGSFAQMDVHNGTIAKMDVPGGGTYAVQGQLTKFVAAPGPLQLLKARWELQDANWFPDFPTSAEKFQWFYEHAGGPTTDGVLAINATFITKLLALTGPIEMVDYGITINAENFLFETEKAVEIDADKSLNTPKAFLRDLAPILLQKMTEADMPTFLAMLDTVGAGLQNKDIQVYFNNNELQAAMNDFGWTGAVKSTTGDYLMMVNTNLGGGKTDAVIEQNIEVVADVAADGSVVDKVTITKIHHGLPDAVFSGRNNVDYLRLYVPAGSQLLTADGFEVPDESLFESSDIPLGMDEDLSMEMTGVTKDLVTGTDVWNEHGKTVFGNWMQTAPGETQVVHFTYRLPFKVTAAPTGGLLGFAKTELGLGKLLPYTMLVQKQAGVELRSTSVRLDLPDNIKVVWSSAEELNKTGVQANNEDDQFYRALLRAE